LLLETLLQNKAVDLDSPDESRENEMGFRFRSTGTVYAGEFMYYVLYMMEPAADTETVDPEDFIIATRRKYLSVHP
jgi:hypothetical protein